MRRRSFRRKVAFLVITAATAFSLLASAQQKKPPAKPPAAPAAPAAKPTGKPPAAPPLKPDPDSDTASSGSKDGGTAAPKEEKAAPASKDPKEKGGAAVESKTLDGGERVFRFGEVEVEGRLKSPQIVYFLRRVRAEFAAGDLGHRTFMRELSETKNEPGF